MTRDQLDTEIWRHHQKSHLRSFRDLGFLSAVNLKLLQDCNQKQEHLHTRQWLSWTYSPSYMN